MAKEEPYFGPLALASGSGSREENVSGLVSFLSTLVGFLEPSVSLEPLKSYEVSGRSSSVARSKAWV